MYGDAMGKLQVYVKSEVQLVLDIEGDQGDVWHVVEETIDIKNGDQVSHNTMY